MVPKRQKWHADALPTPGKKKAWRGARVASTIRPAGVARVVARCGPNRAALVGGGGGGHDSRQPAMMGLANTKSSEPALFINVYQSSEPDLFIYDYQTMSPPYS